MDNTPSPQATESRPAAETSPPPRGGTFGRYAARFPGLTASHQQMAAEAEAVGPLDPRTCALIKIGICLGAGLESALRSHVRTARRHGATEAEIEQATALGMTTCGFPRAVAAWSWAHQQFDRDRREADADTAPPTAADRPSNDPASSAPNPGPGATS